MSQHRKLTLNVLSTFPLDVSLGVMDQGGTKVFHFSVAIKSRLSMLIGKQLLDLEVLDVEGKVCTIQGSRRQNQFNVLETVIIIFRTYLQSCQGSCWFDRSNWRDSRQCEKTNNMHCLEIRIAYPNPGEGAIG